MEHLPVISSPSYTSDSSHQHHHHHQQRQHPSSPRSVSPSRPQRVATVPQLLPPPQSVQQLVASTSHTLPAVLNSGHLHQSNNQGSSRHNVNIGKRSEPLISRTRRHSPVTIRKGASGGESSAAPLLQIPPPPTPANVVQVTSGNSSGGTPGSATSSHQSRSTSQPNTSQEEQYIVFNADDVDLPSLESTANLSNSSSTEFLSGHGLDDTVDSGSGTPDLQRTRAAIEHIHQKVQRTKDQIGIEQKARDENVNEYLKLAGNADKQQLQRIKNVFEKKNQKSAQTISQLQKKLDNYTKRIRELEMHGLSSHHRPAKEVIRDVGQGIKDVGANIRDGITGFSGSVMSKPREFAHLIKNKFGSADNINSMTNTKWFVAEASGNGATFDDATDKNHHHHNSATFSHHPKYTSDDECSSVTSGSGPTGGTGTMSSPRNQLQLVTTAIHPNTSSGGVNMNSTLGGSFPGTSELLPSGLVNSGTVLQPLTHSLPPYANLDPVFQELQERRDECQRLQEYIDSMKGQMGQEMNQLNHALVEERYRYERLEEQMNDLIELHQNEIENLKQGISDMEEKMQYQSEERLRDMHEMMESCQTRISRIEHQQHEQQQLVTLEGIENSNARALVLKLINVLLTVLQVVLLLVATAANILMPFLKTRVRILTTFLLVCAMLCAVQQWRSLVQHFSNLLHRYWNSIEDESISSPGIRFI